MDANLPFDMEEILKKATSDVSVVNIVEKSDTEASDKEPSQRISRASPEGQPSVEVGFYCAIFSLAIFYNLT